MNKAKIFGDCHEYSLFLRKNERIEVISVNVLGDREILLTYKEG